MTRNAITAESRDRQALASAIAAAAIAKANLKAGTAEERNLNTMIGILTLPRCGCNGHPACPRCGWMWQLP